MKASIYCFRYSFLILSYPRLMNYLYFFSPDFLSRRERLLLQRRRPSEFFDKILEDWLMDML